MLRNARTLFWGLAYVNNAETQSAVAKLSSVPVPRPSGGFGEVKLLDPEALL